MKVTSKGQITIPIALRVRLGISPGSVLEFALEGERLYLRKVEDGGTGQELVSRMSGKGEIQMSTAEIMALTRGNL